MQSARSAMRTGAHVSACCNTLMRVFGTHNYLARWKLPIPQKAAEQQPDGGAWGKRTTPILIIERCEDADRLSAAGYGLGRLVWHGYGGEKSSCCRNRDSFAKLLQLGRSCSGAGAASRHRMTGACT